jgi:hypothetical protein
VTKKKKLAFSFERKTAPVISKRGEGKEEGRGESDPLFYELEKESSKKKRLRVLPRGRESGIPLALDSSSS